MIVDDLVDGDVFSSNLEEIESRDKFAGGESKKNLDFFHRLFPDYELEDL